MIIRTANISDIDTIIDGSKDKYSHFLQLIKKIRN